MTVLIFRKDVVRIPLEDDESGRGYEEKERYGFAGIPDDVSGLDGLLDGRYAVLPVDDESGVAVGDADYYNVTDGKPRKVKSP